MQSSMETCRILRFVPSFITTTPPLLWIIHCGSPSDSGFHPAMIRTHSRAFAWSLISGKCRLNSTAPASSPPSAGLGRAAGAGPSLREQMLRAARPHLLRVLGPNCLGVMLPGIGLNASFAHISPMRGSIAFVTQSGGMATAVLDWATGRGIGFSHFVSMGDMADVDFGDMLDYLAADPGPPSVLLYMEAVPHARNFISAARACARLKP